MKKINFFLLSSFLLISSSIFSQSSFDADAAMNRAKAHLKANKPASARATCDSIIKVYPDYLDAYLVIARTNMWKKSYKKAKKTLIYVLEKDAKYYDAHDALTDMYLWSGDYLNSINAADTALNYYPNDNGFKYKKALSLKELESYKPALDLVNEILAADPSNVKALSLKKELESLLMKNKLTLAYIYDDYENTIPIYSQLAFLEYSRNLNFGTLVGRVNWAERYYSQALQDNGFQAEVDAYIKTTPKSYIYLNAGYSESVIFPDFRAGAEFFAGGLPNKFEASIGLRYLLFDPENVFIYTGSVGKYFGNWWLSGRAYITPKDNDVSTSGLLYFRYMPQKEEYFGIRLNAGVLPDFNANILDPTSNYYMNSVGVRLEISKPFAKRWIGYVGLGYENQEWQTDTFRDVLTGELRLSFLF